MAKRKRKQKQPRWRRREPWPQIGLAASLLAVAIAVGLGIWLAARGGGTEGDRGQEPYLTEAAPAFTLPTLTGEEVSLADHLGRHNLLLFFNEGVGCAPCYEQIVDLEKEWGRFEVLDVVLVSIMVDPISQLAPEARLFGVTGENSIVAVDIDKTVSNAYGAMEASMHPGIKPGHSFILVNKAGQIIWRWDWSQGAMYVEVDDVYKEVAKWLKEAG